MNGVASDRMVRSTPSRCHPLDLLVHLEERRVQAEMHAADIEIDDLALAALDLDRELVLRAARSERIRPVRNGSEYR